MVCVLRMLLEFSPNLVNLFSESCQLLIDVHQTFVLLTISVLFLHFNTLVGLLYFFLEYVFFIADLILLQNLLLWQ